MDLEWIKDIGGWGAFLATVWFGGRSFLILARDFKEAVVSELKEINKSIRGQDSRINNMTVKIDRIERKVNEAS